MSTKSFEIPASVKAARVKTRFRPATEQPKGASTPAVKDNLRARIGLDRKHDVSDGLPLTVDTQPDFRWILMCIMYYANLYYSSIDVKNRSKTSPATLVVYFMSIIYAHLLVSDLFLRHTPSHWANDFMNQAYRREYLEFLLSLPVPDILMKFIETLTCTTDPRRPHVQFCPSFAGFSHYHDFGRFFPVSIFMHCHTIFATTKATDQTESVLAKLLQKTTATALSIAMYFGQMLSSTSNSLDYESKLYQSFLALVNPIIERSIQRRNTFAPTNITPITYTDIKLVNPYVMALQCTEDDVTEMQTVLESVAASLDTILPMKGQLGTLYDSLSGIDILRHGYSSYALPTWHYGTVKAPTSSAPSKIQSAKERAASMKFLQTVSPSNATELKYPTDASTINKILYLVKKVTKTDNFPDPATGFRSFHATYDVAPRIRVLDPYDTNVSVLDTVVLCGLIIESMEIDASVVLHPDLDSSLDEENSQVLQSAVPLQMVRRGTFFNGGTTTAAVEAVLRTITTHASQKASTILYDAGESRLGVFDLHVDQAVPTDLPAFRVRDNTSWFSRMHNRFAFKTHERDVENDDVQTRAANGVLVCWSPYRYVPRTWTAASQAEHTYMLLNFRTIYGSNVPLTEIAHPNTVIPIN
uniref:Capsid protein n=1 Tax=Lentinula edodes partitivirus 2 TaxID=2491351 RepID=A0A7S6Z331_9VIRU|nr:capsid protein [Lentinula edodes partitivirus 2]